MSDVHTVSIKQQRGGDNYVSYPAEDTGCSCTPITLICSCLRGEGVSRRGEAKEQREVTLDAYQRVKMAGANFWLSCKCECMCVCVCRPCWHFSRPFCPWLMTNQGGGWVIAFQHLLIHPKSFTQRTKEIKSRSGVPLPLNLLTFAD